MCDNQQAARQRYGNEALQQAAKGPHEKLCDLLKRETGSSVDPLMMRLFIKHHWSKVSKLAHDIHDE